ncbi:MAG TPA: hypothetical protein VGR26_05335, partial [Acidimicrobiales bacterium]|nr:hypothetical protein [Acidimicrobiales bacterium]
MSVRVVVKLRPWAATVLVATIVTATAHAASAGAQQDPDAERERLRSEYAAVAADVDALHATSAEVTNALQVLGANVSHQRALLDEAARAADQAGLILDRAQGKEQRARDELASVEERARGLAVEWFMRPVNDDPMVVLSAESLGDATRRRAFLESWASHQDDVLKELRARSEDMALRRQAAERAAERADRQRVEIAIRIDELERAVAQHQQFASAVEQRLDAKLAEAASLAALDPELAQEIAAEQAAVAGQLRGARLEIASAPHLPAALSLARGGSSIFSIVSVRGIRVHTQLAAQLEALLAAADSDGIQLSGAGYRDASAQVALRRAHCGSSDT